MRAELVHGYSADVLCIDIAADMPALFDDEAGFAGFHRFPCEYRAEKSGADYKIIVFHFRTPVSHACKDICKRLLSARL